MSLGKQQRIEEFLRKSLLGEELINTQFHLFSSRSVPSSRLTKPRALCANNVLLAKSSTYFVDLLSSDLNSSDGSLSDITDANDVPSHIQIDDYGYGSDSDLDDDDEPSPIADTEAAKAESAMRPTTAPQISIKTQPKDDDELSDDGSESASSDMFVMSPEHPRMGELIEIINAGEVGSVTRGETAVRESLGNKIESASQTAMRLRSLGSRHVLVKDTAFQTWYTLMNYLYTDKINFEPLGLVMPAGQPRESSANSLDEPRCSAKSMYRLACKVGLDDLREEALAHIRSNLTEHNILKELSCSLVSSHPQLLEMELDVLYAHIGSPPVVTGFPALAQRIAQKELRHGADIIVGIHTRLLKERQPLPLLSRLTSPISRPLTPPPAVPCSPPPLFIESFVIDSHPVVAEDLSEMTETVCAASSITWGSWHNPEIVGMMCQATEGPLDVDVKAPASHCSAVQRGMKGKRGKKK
ncbi:hypothetical protein JVT61DRAFT_14317 [Boletus reticuloceps]|uniref:BTB domain-containing protein n=1 Tax=Boletus reticuloceps TaxID=495285 RepID=A0A8I2YCU4_9AGAM|nr:hypothetical protein JVT61DRAFT_14317 [Boletus reticuloceps]